MPAVSKQQQKLFGLALSVKRGDTPRSEVSDDVRNIVDTMSEKEIEKYAGTGHTGLPTKKEEVEELIRQEVRNYVRPVIGEGRAFINAARKSKEEGKTEFEFNGKTYPVTIKEGVLNEMTDLEYVGDQLVNGVGEGFMSRNEFVKLVGKETKYDKNTLGKIYDAYLKLDGRNRVKLDMTRNMDKFLKKMGLKEGMYESVVNEALVTKDKKAVDAFFDKKDFEGKNVNSDGKTLSTAGLGAQDMFTHTSKGVKMVGKVAGRYTQSLVKYVNKNYKSDLVESVLNEVVSKTYKIPTQRGTLQLKIEEDPDGVIVDVIFNRVMLSTIDVQFPTGKVEVKQRYKKVKLKESVVNEAQKVPPQFISFLKMDYKNVKDTPRERKKLSKKLRKMPKDVLKQLADEDIGVLSSTSKELLGMSVAESVVNEGKIDLSSSPFKESVNEVTRLTMSKPQMNKLHKAYGKLTYDQMKRMMLSVATRDKFIKSLKKWDKKSLQQLVDMQPNSPFSKTVQSYIDGKIKESVVNEGKFKKDDLVYNKKTKRVGIVRVPDEPFDAVELDVDGAVDVKHIEKYDPYKHKHHEKAKVDKSTQKEVNKRGLWQPFKKESVVSEKKVPKKGSPDYHQHKIAVDTVKNPRKSFMGGPSATEAEETLMDKFGYSKKEIEKLKG